MSLLVEAPYESLIELRERAKTEIAKVVIGQERAVELLLIAALARGHVLLEGPPGSAKTLLARATAHMLGAKFKRIQFTPDTTPAELTGINAVRMGEQVFFPNHRDDIERFAHEIRERDVRPEMEVYSVPMLEEVEHLLGLEILEPPYAINLVLHTPTQGGQRGTPRNLLDLHARLRDLPVPYDTLQVTVSSMGRTQLPITTIGLAMGLNVRVGMEDNVYYRRGELVRDNAQLVERTVRIARELGREPATPAAARQLLGLRGREPGRLPA